MTNETTWWIAVVSSFFSDSVYLLCTTLHCFKAYVIHSWFFAGYEFSSEYIKFVRRSRREKQKGFELFSAWTISQGDKQENSSHKLFICLLICMFIFNFNHIPFPSKIFASSWFFYFCTVNKSKIKFCRKTPIINILKTILCEIIFIRQSKQESN